MNDRMRDAYYEHCLALAREGTIDDSLNDALLDGKSVDEHMIDVLRATGKLPEEAPGASPRDARAGALTQVRIRGHGCGR